MADFFFFTDIDLLENQEKWDYREYKSDNFDYLSPIASFSRFKENHNSSNGNKPLNGVVVTSQHKAKNTINPNAYAICDGDVIVLPIKNSNLVNLVLKPKNTPTNLPSVRYIIYRGILKDSLFQVDTLNPYPAGHPLENEERYSMLPDSTDNDLLHLMHSGEGIPSPNDLSCDLLRMASGAFQQTEAFKISPYSNTIDSLESLKHLDTFFLSDKSFDIYTAASPSPSLPSESLSPKRISISGGMSLGKFPKGNQDSSKNLLEGQINLFGIDMVIDNPSFNFDLLSLKRCFNNTYNSNNSHNPSKYHLNIIEENYFENTSGDIETLAQVSGTNHDADAFQVKKYALRERCLSYIDPCAFFSSFIFNSDNLFVFVNDKASYSIINDEGTNIVAKEICTFEDGEIKNTEVFKLKHLGVYNVVLKGKDKLTANSQNFGNLNRVYFDVRDMFNNSYNLFRGNMNILPTPPSRPYGNLITIKHYLTGNTFDEVQVDVNGDNVVANKNYNIPLISLEQDRGSSILGLGGENIFRMNSLMSGNGINKTIKISFQFPCNDDDLQRQYTLFDFSNRDKKQKFIHLEQNGGNITNEVDSKINIYGWTNNSITSEENKAICSYNRFVFIEHFTDIENPLVNDNNILENSTTVRGEFPPNFKPYEYLSNVFVPFKMLIDIPLKSPNNVILNVYRDSIYIDNSRNKGNDFYGDVAIGKDNENVYIIANSEYARAANQNLPVIFYKEDKTEKENNQFNIITFEKKLGDSTSLLGVLLNRLYGEKDKRPEYANSITAKKYDMPNGYSVNCIEVEDVIDSRQVTRTLDFTTILNINKNVYNDLTIDYKIATENQNLDIHLPIYLAFQFVEIETIGTDKFVKYHAFLKGYKKESDSSYHYYSPKFYNEIPTSGNERYVYVKIEKREAYSTNYMPLARDNSHRHPDLTHLPIENRILSDVSPPITKQCQIIDSRLYFVRDLEMNRQDFFNFVSFIKRDIEKVWSSHYIKNYTPSASGTYAAELEIAMDAFGNMGLLEAQRNKPNTGDNLPIKCEIKVANAIPPVFKIIENTENLIYLYIHGRSNINAGRLGKFHFEDDMIDHRHVPAHEFGHILGLTDRYAEHFTLDFATSPSPLVDAYLGSVTLFYSEDDFYQEDYTWHHNLMAAGKAQVPDSFDATDISDTQYLYFYNKYMPSDGAGGVGNKLITSFITPDQWDEISNKRKESIPFSAHLYFSDNMVVNNPKFIGTEGTNINVDDNTFTQSTPSSIHDGEMDVRKIGANMIHARLKIDAGVTRLNSNDNSLDDVFSGGVNSVKNLIDNDKISGLGSSGIIDLTGNNDLFKAEANGKNSFFRNYTDLQHNLKILDDFDSYGLALWNLASSTNNTTTHKGKTIKYNEFANRKKILELLRAAGI